MGTFIIYIDKTWQCKFDEMKNLVNIFIEDEENVVEKIKEYATGKSILVVFDNMINSKSLSTLAALFTVDRRHMNKFVKYRKIVIISSYLRIHIILQKYVH